MSCGELSGPGGELAALRGVRTTVASGPEDLALLARVRRETYVGPWLPDPLIEEAGGEPGSQVELEDSLCQAFLVMLERLTATERAALLLRDVFDYGYREIAEVIDRSQATCRQLVSRARKHLRSNGPRFDADVGLRDRLLEQFLAAAEEGDLDALEALLAEDAVLYSDGGGKAIAARRPIFGSPRIARVMAAVTRKQRRRGPLALQLAHVNGQPGRILRTPDGRVWEVLSIDVVGGRIQTVRIVRNPDKLANV